MRRKLNRQDERLTEFLSCEVVIFSVFIFVEAELLFWACFVVVTDVLREIPRSVTRKVWKCFEKPAFTGAPAWQAADFTDDRLIDTRAACAPQTLLENHFFRRQGSDDLFKARIAAERIPTGIETEVAV